ncbi:MAG: hypothetical protein ACRD8K_08875 [Nitrososphaeraceae archaeon]
MSEDIGNHNNNEISNNNKKKTILLVTDNIQHYQQHFNNYNINYYKITFINWNDILTFITNLDNDANKHKNLELIILDISTTVVVIEHTKINQISITIFREIKKIFPDKRIFFIWPSESMIEKFVSMGISTEEDIRIQPFSVFDVTDLISTTKKKERLDRLILKDHCMHTYSSTDGSIKDAIKFLKIGLQINSWNMCL